MPMRISLALGKHRTLSRQTAWGCLTTNLAMPGFGSLIAGRVSGYPQAALGLGGLGLTLVFWVRFVLWYLANWSHLNDPMADPLATMSELWQAVRLPLLGMGIFAVGLLWALVTSWSIVRAARQAEQRRAPPRLERH
jgi:hypothetical protein